MTGMSAILRRDLFANSPYVNTLFILHSFINDISRTRSGPKHLSLHDFVCLVFAPETYSVVIFSF